MMTSTPAPQPTPLVKAYLSTPAGMKVLDIGCGEGRNSLFLATQHHHVTAIDTDPAVVAQARTNAAASGLSVEVHEANLLSYTPPIVFNAIIANMVLHFLSAADVRAAITRIQSWTEASGINILTAFTTLNPIGTRPYLFKPGELRQYYEDWDVLLYEEGQSTPIIEQGIECRYDVARLVARKV